MYFTEDSVLPENMQPLIINACPYGPEKPSGLGDPQGNGSNKITAEALYPRGSRFLKPNES